MRDKQLTTTAPRLDIAQLDPLRDKLDMTGLNYKQRRFCFLYNGNARAAAEAAGYCANCKSPAHKTVALSRVVSCLMKNVTIQRNIFLIQKEMEAFGVLSVAEAKDIISELARTSESERIRMEAAKLALKWEGAFIERVIIDERKAAESLTINILGFDQPITIGADGETRRLEEGTSADDDTIDAEFTAVEGTSGKLQKLL